MTRDVTATAQEAMRLKMTLYFRSSSRTPATTKRSVVTSGPKDIEVREEAHAIIRALEAIEIQLDAAIGAEISKIGTSTVNDATSDVLAAVEQIQVPDTSTMYKYQTLSLKS